MSPAYRDDPAGLRDLGQHLSIATALLEQFTAVPARLARGGELREDVSRDARVAWEGLWEQLDQARALALGLGRNVAAYDRARAAAANIWLGAAEVRQGPTERVLGGYRQTYVWKHAPTRPAIDAIVALRRAVPEAAPPLPLKQARVDLRIRPGNGGALLAWLMIATSMFLFGWCSTH
jgi:hypothetical protein